MTRFAVPRFGTSLCRAVWTGKWVRLARQAILTVLLWIAPDMATHGITRPAVPRMIFAHYMVCCTAGSFDPTVAMLVHEIDLARLYGIDGFALNIGEWTTNRRYMQTADRMFAAARTRPGFVLFLSIDGLSPEDAVAMLRRYRDEPAYLRVEGRPLLSTFSSTPAWAQALRHTLAAQRQTMFFVPHEYPAGPGNVELPDAATVARQYRAPPQPDGYFYFGAAGPGTRLAQVNRWSAQAARGAGLRFMASVSPYYHGHGNNARVFDNGGFAGMAAQWRAAVEGGADWVQIVSWNDFQENTYVRPAGDPTLRAIGEWPARLPHDGFVEASQAYIRWFKTGSIPPVRRDRVHLFYRPQPHADCAGPCPLGADTLADRLYLMVEARRPTRITVQSGGRTMVLTVPAGRSDRDVPLTPGAISLEAVSGDVRRRWNAPAGFGAANNRLNEAMLAWSF